MLQTLALLVKACALEAIKQGKVQLDEQIIIDQINTIKYGPLTKKAQTMKQITSNGRFWRNLLAAGLLLGGAVNVMAWEKPHTTGQFELDGNIFSESAVPGDDWQDIANGLDSAFSDSGIIADGLGMSIFTGGASKDVRDIDQWRWTDGSRTSSAATSIPVS
ncbi:MAG: hypothetical protein IE886_07095 [Campylobacterales bacterium]|nr:hypothetical protein [Campylobacterales bacterium]